MEKGGVDAVTLQPLFPAQSSACEPGEACAIVYMNVASAFDGAQGNELPNAYMAARGAGGWQTTALTPPTLQPPANAQPKVSYAFSADLSQAVLRVPLQRLTQNAPTGVDNLYLREADGAYSLVTALPPTEPPPTGCGSCFATEDVPAFAGASSDFSHVIFEANDSLVAGAPGGGVENLYEAVAEHVRLVGILPDGTIPEQGATAGGGIRAVDEHTHELAHAISQDGSRVLFEAAADRGARIQGRKARQDSTTASTASSTVKVSAPAPGARTVRLRNPGTDLRPRVRAVLDGIGRRLARLLHEQSCADEGVEHRPRRSRLADEEDAGNDLYRYDVETGALTDLTVDPGDGNGASGSSAWSAAPKTADTSTLSPKATRRRRRKREAQPLRVARNSRRIGHDHLHRDPAGGKRRKRRRDGRE